MTRREKDGGYRLSFSCRYGKVRIHRTVLSVLGNPKFVQFLIQPDQKILIVCGTDVRLAECFEVPAGDALSRNGFVLNGQAFIRRVSRIVGWNPEHIYVVEGEYNGHIRAVVFDLTKSVIKS